MRTVHFYHAASIVLLLLVLFGLSGCGLVHDAVLWIRTIQSPPDKLYSSEFYVTATAEEVREAINGRSLAGESYTRRSVQEYPSFFIGSLVSRIIGLFIPNTSLAKTTLTPLTVALASTRNPEVIKMLLEAGAIADKETMLNISRYDTGSDREIAFLLLRYASPEEICENIHNFVADGSRDMLDYCFITFVSASSNCAMRDNGMTPFLYATTGINGERRSTEMVRYLLEKGADIEKPDAFGNRPLYLALYHGRVETATILLDHGAEACSGKDGKSLLYLAVIKGKVQDEDLLRRLADQVPLTGTMEEQSVQAACYSGNVSVLSILLARGATLWPGVIYEVGEKVPGKEKMRAFLAAKGLKTTAVDTDDNQ